MCYISMKIQYNNNGWKVLNIYFFHIFPVIDKELTVKENHLTGTSSFISSKVKQFFFINSEKNRFIPSNIQFFVKCRYFFET